MSIESKIHAFLQSSAGQKLMSDTIAGYRASGKTKTAGGSKLVTEKDIRQIASELADEIRRQAASAGVPASVLEDMTMAMTASTDSNEDKYEAELYFTGDLHRNSLYEEGYPDGLFNVVALFNNGYVTSHDVYGWWDGHSFVLGNYMDMRNPIGRGDGFVWIRGKRSMPPLGFMQNAVDRIKQKYNDIDLSITLSNDYDGDWSL